MGEDTPVKGGDPRVRIPHRRLRWFLAGFLIVFACLLLAYPAEFYDGRAIYQTKLWHYYLLEIRQQVNSSGFAGPTSGNFAVLLRTILLHVSVACLGGVASLALARAFRRSVPR